MTTDFWIQKIQEWGTARKIIGPDAGGSVGGQTEKLGEEYEELQDALYQGDLQAAADAIGDMTVVLIMLCDLLKLDFKDCLHLAWNQIRHRKGKMVNGVFVKESE